MFVKINEQKSAVEIDGLLKRKRNLNNGKLHPDVAMQALSHTNHFVNIKFIIKEINTLSDEDKLGFKEFVLSAINGREHTPQNLKDLRKIAVIGGYAEEFDNIISENKEKVAYPSNNFLIIRPGSRHLYHKYGALEAEDYDELRGDFSKYDAVMIEHFDYKDEMYGRDEEVVVTGDDVVLPKKLIFMNVDRVNFCNIDMANVREIVYEKRLDVFNVRNLSSDIAIQGKEFLYLGGVNLAECKNIKLQDKSSLLLCDISDFPDDFDVSMCEELRMQDVDISKMPKQDFTNVKYMDIYRCNIPSWFDVSNCCELGIGASDLGAFDEMKFKSSSDVVIRKCKSLPKVLDFSMCSKVLLEETDMSGVEKIIFKDKAQKTASKISGYKGNIVYSDKSSLYDKIFGNRGLN